jgi:hypothetical protein
MLAAESRIYSRSGAPLGTWIGLRQPLRLLGLTGFPLHPGSVRPGFHQGSFDDCSADPLVHGRIAVRVQNNFHPFPNTQLCEQSGNMVHDLVCGNLELRGNLLVRQADRDEAYQLFVALGELRCLLILHIAFVDSVNVPEKLLSRRRSRESPFAGIVRRIRASVSQSGRDFTSPNLAVSGRIKTDVMHGKPGAVTGVFTAASAVFRTLDSRPLHRSLPGTM